jgi:cobalt-zinc-cadmium efflux system protein
VAASRPELHGQDDHDHHGRQDHGSHEGHGHGHRHGHSHAGGVTDERRIAGAFIIIFVFMFIEAAGGLISGSLALLADAGHMVSDAVALGMSWAAFRIGRRPADAERSYGYQRVEVLVAYSNGCTLIAIAAWIVYEAARRFVSPIEVLGGPMLAVAVAGLVANAAAFAILHGGSRENLNIRSAWLHVLGDLLAFIAAIVAAAIILWTGWWPIDPILSVLVAALILKSASEIVRSSAHVLLEGTPPGLDLNALPADLAASVPSIADVHHVHAWSIIPGRPMVTLHVRCKPGADPAAVIRAINDRLKVRFGITHSTIQTDPPDCPDEEHH